MSVSGLNFQRTDSNQPWIFWHNKSPFITTMHPNVVLWFCTFYTSCGVTFTGRR